MLKHVQPGQPFEPSSSQTNAFVDAALWVEQHRGDADSPPVLPIASDATLIEIVNTTGAELPRWGVFKVGDAAVLPTDDQDLFEGSNLFEADLPTDDLLDIHAIALQTLDTNEVGVAIISGTATVQIDVSDEDHRYATPIDGDVEKLASAGFAAFMILWKESGTGVKWAKVVYVGSPALQTVKSTTTVVAGSTEEYDVWEDGADTGTTIQAKWGWAATSGTNLSSGTDCLAARVSLWDPWVIVGWDCDGVIPTPGGPTADPPVADLVVDTGTPGEVTLDGSGSTPDAGLSITNYQYVLNLPSSEFLIIAGIDANPPNYVYDSRGTLTIADVGTVITGNINTITIDESGASISAPYAVTLIVTQSDTQTDVDVSP